MHNNHGVTPSEQFLGQLCRASFLNIWSYQNLFNDKGVISGKGEGKELCDLLVVFENDIIIFSDKSCAVNNSGDIVRDWQRWFRRAIKKSADQVYGAERWIKRFSDRIFLDKECNKPFPLSLLQKSNQKIHRVVVALGAGKEIERYYGNGSSGSLMYLSFIKGDDHFKNDAVEAPFKVGQVYPDKGFIHILDDVTLKIVLEELDTISDFVAYLNAREAFLSSGKNILVMGEEDLLAYYLGNMNKKYNYSFPMIKGYRKHDTFIISEGLWDEYQGSLISAFRSELKSQSKFIDELIELISGHVLDGTLAYGSDRHIDTHERNLRFIAAENRYGRAQLANVIKYKMHTTPKNVRSGIIVKSATNHQVRYIFVLFPRNETQSEDDYRKARQAALLLYSQVAKLMNMSARYFVAIATEPGESIARSEDLMSFDFYDWTDEDTKEAKKIRLELEIFSDYKKITP